MCSLFGAKEGGFRIKCQFWLTFYQQPPSNSPSNDVCGAGFAGASSGLPSTNNQATH
jgi:hypothetical protein